jgi:hypothetical protein
MTKTVVFLIFISFFQACGGESTPNNQLKNDTKEAVIEIKNEEYIDTDKTKEINETKEVENTPIEKIIKKPLFPTAIREEELGENVAKDIFDSSFEKESSNMNLAYGAKYDETIKRSGKRSIKLTNNNDIVNIYNIPVEEGSWYIFRGYMYVSSTPSDIVRFYIGYSNHGTHIRSIVHTILSNSKANHWEEFVVPVYIQKHKNITDIKCFIRNTGGPNTAISSIGDIWIDDVTVHKVRDSSQLFGETKPSIKQAFDGAYVKIDALGNFSVKKDEEFKPFFPVIIYPGGQSKWNSYAKHGFNTVVCNYPGEAQIAADNGMYWIWDLYGYGINDFSASGYDRFVSEYKDMKKHNPKLLDKLLYFYWDNEQYDVLDSFTKFTDKIKTMDVDADGNRLRPINMNLNLTPGHKNYYNEQYKLIDMQSVYANPLLYQENDRGSYDYELKNWYNTEFAHFSVFEHLPNVTIPKSVFLVDSPHDTYIENIIFAAIARGGKGFAFWRDSGSQPEIETKVWWDSFPQTVAKIEKLLPLIREPHWTNWKLEYSEFDDEDGIVVGKRDYNDKRCMVVASRADISKTITFSTPDRDMGTLYNFFDNSLVASPSAGSVTLSLPAHGSGVYCW